MTRPRSTTPAVPRQRTAQDGAGRGADRRQVVSVLGAGLITATLVGCGKDAKSETPAVPERNDGTEISIKEARARLQEGNLRFVEGKSAHPDQTGARRKKLATAGQKPFACVLACSDSRVPPELLFDQGLGDLFVVRSAGQVLDDAVLGTLQFGVAEFSTPLLLVVGHTKCGAVKATIEALEKKSPASGTAVDALIAALTPSVVEAEEAAVPESDLPNVVVSNNVERIVAQLSASPVLAMAVKTRKLKIQGAMYDIETGEVDFS